MEYLFVIKNYFRTDFVNLTVKSIRHFMPNAKIACLNLYKTNINEYKKHYFFQIDEIFYRKSKYDSNGLGGSCHPHNSLFFSEGYNYIYDRYKHLKKCKILVLGEDHFFTNGRTIKEFIDQDFDIASGIWHHTAIPKDDPINPPWMSRITVPSWMNADGSCEGAGWSINASILGLNLSEDSLKEIFPLPERILHGVESTLKEDVVKKAKKLHIFSSRIGIDYGGDGVWSNDLEEIRRILIENRILKKEELMPKLYLTPTYSKTKDMGINKELNGERSNILWPPRKTNG